MKTLIVSLVILVVSQLTVAAPQGGGSGRSSATLVLSGVVPDRGYTVKGATISPSQDTQLKVFIASYIQANRGPASVNSIIPDWTELKGPKKLTTSSYVMVVAP